MPLTPRPTTRPASSKLPSTPCSAAAVASCLPPSLRSFGARQRALMRFGSLQRMRLMAATFPIAAHRGALRHGTAGLPHLPSTAPTGFLDPLTHCSAVQPFQPCFMLVTLVGFAPTEGFPHRLPNTPHDRILRPCHTTRSSLHAVSSAAPAAAPKDDHVRKPPAAPRSRASGGSVLAGRCYPVIREPILS